MKYLELNALYIEAQAKQNAWLDSLYHAARLLLNQVSNDLEPPEPWENEGKRHPYVSLLALPAVGNKVSKLTQTDLNSDINGVFAFGISITFEPAPMSFPKSDLWLPIGVKAFNSQIHYALWNRELNAPDEKTGWIDSVAAASAMVIQRMQDNFMFDPASDFAKRPKIGFA
jgi:hypothetical protein